MFTRKPGLQLGKIVITSAKRLLQADIYGLTPDPFQCASLSAYDALS